MANIVISYFSDYGEAMYDAITNVLLKNGNNVFRFNINNPAVSITKWGGKSLIKTKKLLDKIKDFKPDIVMNFNNCLPQNCYKILDKKCKVLVIDADAPEVAFWNKEMINKYLKQVVFLGLQSYSKKMYERYLGIKISEKNYLYFPPATIVKNEKLKQDKNISFIGSNFYPLEVPIGTDFFSQDGIELYNAFEKNYFLTLDEAKTICKNTLNVEWLHENVSWVYAGQDRLRHMQQLTDLGFTFYGTHHWNRIAYYDFEIARCFDPTPKTTIEENQWVYNTSKIAVNFSHPLAKSSFSWRVMDIMASNSCLLTEDKPDWRELFEKYLSKDVLDIIIYKDRFDMREKAKRLLSDEKLRQKCVKELNNAIEQNGRWEIRFKSLEQFLNIPLLSVGKQGKLIKIERYKKVEPQKKLVLAKKKTFIQRLRLKNRIKMCYYLLCLLYAQIPFVDFFIRKQKRQKWKNKIEKWWR